MAATQQGQAGIFTGDKNGGSRVPVEERGQRHATANATHVPDAVRYSATPECYEFKSITPFHPDTNTGSRGGVSTSEGDRFAFGNTEENEARNIFGVEGRDSHLTTRDRRTGLGVVLPKQGYYGDGLAKGHHVSHLHTETTGALAAPLLSVIRTLHKATKPAAANDSTVYGSSRSSTHSFTLHHVACVSSAILRENTVYITTAATRLRYHLLHCSLAPSLDWKALTKAPGLFDSVF